MIKKRDIVIAITFFIFGLGSMYFYNKQELKIKDDTLIDFTKVCIKVKEIDQHLLDRCEQDFAYTIDCVVNSSCTPEQALQINKDRVKEREALEQEEQALSANFIKQFKKK